MKNPPAEAPPKARQLIALDGLRAFAALAVFLGHARAFFFVPWKDLQNSEKNPLTSVFYLLSRSTSEAVLIFFVLSGFFVGGQVLNRFESSRWRAREYIIDRVTRIYLPLIPCLIYSCIVGFVFLDGTENIINPLSSLLLLNDIIWPTTAFNPPLWTITYEMWFYILLPALICMYLGNPGKIHLFLTVVGIAVFGKLHSDFFLFWIFGAVIYKCRFRLSQKYFAALGFTILVLSYLYFETHRGEGKILARDQLIYCQAFLCAGFSLTIPFLSSDKVNMSLKKFSLVFSRMADYSYTIYLFHYPTLCLISIFVRPSAIFSPFAIFQYLSGVGLCFIICIIWWNLFERQTHHARKFLKEKLL